MCNFVAVYTVYAVYIFIAPIAGWYLGATLQYPRMPQSTELEEEEEVDGEEEEDESDAEEDMPAANSGVDEYEELAKKYEDFKMVSTCS